MLSGLLFQPQFTVCSFIALGFIYCRLKLPPNTDIMPVVDLSGSMTGTPIKVARAMGYAIAYAQSSDPDAAYARMVLTFDTDPHLYLLPDIFGVDGSPATCSIATVCEYMDEKPWGGSTDFYKSMRLMLRVITNKYPHGTTRRQVVFVVTDMQWNHADRGNIYATTYELLRKMFAEANVPMPIVFLWNARGDVCAMGHQGLPTATDQPGVIYLSGYSADLLRDVFEMLRTGDFRAGTGEAEEPFIESARREQMSTDDIMRKLFDSPMYARYARV